MVIVGLGNPGGEYAQTRHNVGFWCVDRLAEGYAIGFSRRHRSALVGDGVIEGRRVVLAKPRNYVNRSGEAIVYLLARFKVSPRHLVVVCDDMDLPLGKIRLRPRGSAGGHNGIRSIIDVTGTQEFARLRVGIGRPKEGASQVDYVLAGFPDDEQEAADQAVELAAQAVVSVLTDGVEIAMNRFN